MINQMNNGTFLSLILKRDKGHQGFIKSMSNEFAQEIKKEYFMRYENYFKTFA